MDIYNRLYGDEGGTLHYKVNIIGIYKTEGTIWMKQKKSKFVDEKYIAWNNDVTYHRLERKKNTVTIYDAHSDKRDKYATKFKFDPNNYQYSIKDEKEKGFAITLKAKKGAKGIKCWIAQLTIQRASASKWVFSIPPSRLVTSSWAVSKTTCSNSHMNSTHNANMWTRDKNIAKTGCISAIIY